MISTNLTVNDDASWASSSVLVVQIKVWGCAFQGRYRKDLCVYRKNSTNFRIGSRVQWQVWFVVRQNLTRRVPGGWGVASGQYVASRSAILALPLSLSPVPKSVGSEVNLQKVVLLSRSTEREILLLTISNRSVYCVKTRQFVSSPMPNIRQSVFAIIHICI